MQEKLIDEALVQLESLPPQDVADPAGLLFYQAVVYHDTLQKKPGLESIAKLLEPGRRFPAATCRSARLMQADLAPLKDDSLDHIARRMDDIRRRLDLGRAGPKVREVEDGVIKSLDKLIEEMEKPRPPRPRRDGSRRRRGNIRSRSPGAGQHADRRQGAGQHHEEGHRPRKRLGRLAAQAAAGSAAADRQGFSGPLPRRDRTILPQIGQRGIATTDESFRPHLCQYHHAGRQPQAPRLRLGRLRWWHGPC